MSFHTGQDGYLEVNTKRIARVQSWQITSTTQLESTTKVGDCEKTYRAGPGETRGTAVIWYYNDAPKSLLDRLFNTSGPKESVQFKLGWGTKQMTFYGIVTSASIACQTGAVMQANIGFTMTGKLTSVTL